MDGVARVTQHGRDKRLIQTIAHSAAGGLRAAFVSMTRFLREVQDTPQLSAIQRWCRILGYALRKWFRGKVPDPPPGLLPARASQARSSDHFKPFGLAAKGAQRWNLG